MVSFPPDICGGHPSPGTDRGSAHPAALRPRGRVCGEPHLGICAVRGGELGPAWGGPALPKGPLPTCSSLLRKLPASPGMVQEGSVLVKQKGFNVSTSCKSHWLRSKRSCARVITDHQGQQL